MTTFEEQIEALVAPGPDRALAGVTFATADKNGTKYFKSFGQISLDADAPALKDDAVMRLASCTKLATSICALQCVEKGLLTLDDDLSKVLPELNEIEVLIDEDGKQWRTPGEINTRPRKEVFTLRKLLSHQSGFIYGWLSPRLAPLVAEREPDPEKASQSFDVYAKLPTIFEPGKGWAYGPSIDWVGRAIERVNGGARLREYMEKNLWKPLGIKDICFDIDTRPDMKERYVPTMIRDEQGLRMPKPERYWPMPPTDDMGGGGLIASTTAFFDFLKAVFHRDPRLLTPESYALMHEPQVKGPTRPVPFAALFPNYESNRPDQSQRVQWAHGLASAILLSDHPGWLRRGTLHWAGVRNHVWFIDHASGLVSFMATQISPYEEKHTMKVKSLFQSEMLRRFAPDVQLPPDGAALPANY